MLVKDGQGSLQATSAPVLKHNAKKLIVSRERNRIEFVDSRYYLDPVSLEFFPSSTTILDCYPKDQHFYEWLKEVGNKADEIRDAAGDKGSTVHYLTEQYDSGNEVVYLGENDKPRYSIQEWAMFERYVDFVKRFSPQIEHIEYSHVSRQMGYGGTWDRKWICPTISPNKAIIDIKTSNYVHESYWVQLASYVKLHNEIFPEDKITEAYILWLNAKTRTYGKKGEPQGPGWQLLSCPEPLEDYMKDWEATKYMWYRKNKKVKPRNLVYSIKHNPYTNEQL